MVPDRFYVKTISEQLNVTESVEVVAASFLLRVEQSELDQQLVQSTVSSLLQLASTEIVTNSRTHPSHPGLTLLTVTLGATYHSCLLYTSPSPRDS